jgi:acetyltransferase-like isoleucine patch superfamily enzyme
MCCSTDSSHMPSGLPTSILTNCSRAGPPTTGSGRSSEENSPCVRYREAPTVTDHNDLAPLNASRLFLMEILEPLVRLASWLGPLIQRDQDGLAMALRGRVLAGSRQLAVGRNVNFVGPARRFRLGTGVTFFGNCYLNSNGPDGLVEIGRHTHVDQFCVLYGQGKLSVGADCAIASGVVIYSQTNADSQGDGTPVACQPTAYAPVHLGAGCWLGAGVCIIPGVTIGDGCHIGAGAVVTTDLPPRSVAVGTPARVIKKRAQ